MRAIGGVPVHPYNDLLTMKFTVAIPSVQIPRAPTIHFAPQLPKFRVPFLSLLLEAKPLKKWLLIWLFCLYLAFCIGCFFQYEQPRLDHETYIRFGADSPTYWEVVNYRRDHAVNASLVSFTGNLLGPVTIGVLLRSGFAVALFNIFLFFISVEIAATIPGVDKYLLVFLLSICSETVAALVTLNKEILVLLSAFIFAKYVYSERRSWFLLAAALVISLFARWEQIFLILLFLFLRRKGSFFARNPKLAVLSVIGALTVLYGLIARVPGSGLKAFTNYSKGANTIVLLNAIQANFGFPLVLAPKILMDMMGELLRPLTFIALFGVLGTGDIHSMIILPLFSIALVILLYVAYRKGLLNPKHPLALLMIIYTVMTAITPFVQPRYLYFVYVLCALELSMKYDAGVLAEAKG
jgi:hypothetical protein